jgi:hypothetical protein
MASTSTQTATATKTFTRVRLLKMQVNIALRRTTQISEDILESTFAKGIERQWINKIMVYGVDSKNYCLAQLTLDVDWDEHNLQINCGKLNVQVSEKWKDSIAIELDEVIKSFNEYVNDHSLTTKVQFSCVNGLDMGMIDRELNACSSQAVEWKTSSWSSSIPELSELRVGYYLADE